MMQDANQKEMLYRHFRAQDWYAIPEVPVYYKGGLEDKPRMVTDVDVLGIRPTPDLSWEFVIGDCKTKKSESPANRALWVRSLIDHFGASRALVVLKKDNGIEGDHKLFAHANSVTLIEESEFQAYDRAMVFPLGSFEFPETLEDLKAIREGTPGKYPGFTPLSEYINFFAWNELDHFVMLRKVISKGRGVRFEVDPTKIDHLALMLEAAGVFAIGLATCVGTIFHQYLQPNQPEALDRALKILIWGGNENYQRFSLLRKQLAEAKGVRLDEEGLSLPEWPDFLQLVRSHLAAPKLAFRVPQLLRSLALDLFKGQTPLSRVGPSDLMLLKFSMQTAIYYAQAAGLPPDTKQILKDHFLSRIDALASKVGTKIPESTTTFETKMDNVNYVSIRPVSRQNKISTGGPKTRKPIGTMQMPELAQRDLSVKKVKPKPISTSSQPVGLFESETQSRSNSKLSESISMTTPRTNIRMGFTEDIKQLGESIRSNSEAQMILTEANARKSLIDLLGNETNLIQKMTFDVSIGKFIDVVAPETVLKKLRFANLLK